MVLIRQKLTNSSMLSQNHFKSENSQSAGLMQVQKAARHPETLSAADPSILVEVRSKEVKKK